VLQWLTWEASTVIPALMSLYRARIEKTDDAPDMQRVQSVLCMLDHQLNRGDWVAENYSIADVALGAGVPALLSMGVSFEAYPALRRWLMALRLRTAWHDPIFVADLRAGGLI
jgi:glutathione S-transferase